MTDAISTAGAPAPTLHRFADSLMAFCVGLWLALLQFSFFFLLEVRLTSRTTTFFVALFFWLVGFLAGLNLRSPRAFPLLVALAPAAYYVAYLVLGLLPYRVQVLPLVGACIAVAGSLAGAFFPYAAGRFGRLKLLLFHENNGFVLGILLSLFGAVFAGRFLLDWAPALAALPVVGFAVSSVRAAGK